MANLMRNVFRSKQLFRDIMDPSKVIFPIRNASVYSETGALYGRPSQVNLGLLKVTVVTLPFLYLGATISKNGAAFLEENDIFVPDDDDD